MSGPRADWPGPDITWKDVLAAQSGLGDDWVPAGAGTVGSVFWYLVVDRWCPEDGTADVTVYEYPTDDPSPEGRQVWGCILDEVRRAEQLVPAAVERMAPTPWQIVGQWRQEGDRWLAPVRIHNP